MTLLERAARAAFAADYPQHVDANLEIDEAGMVLYEKRHLWYLDAARDVLRAIREPSGEYVNQVAEQADDVIAWGDYGEFWQAMIDAIISEKS